MRLRRRPLECINKTAPADGPVFLDLFSGQGGLARAVETFSGYSLQWDIKHGEAYDLTLAKNVRTITEWMRGGRTWGVHVAMLCKSWSTARRGGNAPPLRSAAKPWGLPELKPDDQEGRDGALLKNSLKIMRVATDLGLFCI